MQSAPKFKHRLCHSAVLSAFALTLPAAALAQSDPQAQTTQAAPAADGAAAGDTATVVVTARRFTERLVDVPIAISVMTNADLVKRGANGIGDVLQTVPGVSAYDAGAGVTKISIRGISTSLGGNENGYYLDDLPFTGVTVPISPDVRAWDVDRIEVLRGPQGTLFGEGSMGGTIRTLTNNARLNTFSFAGQTGLSHTEGGGNNRAVKAMVNVPLIDDMLALRIAATDENYKGWIDAPAQNRSDINKTGIKTQRARLLFRPTDALTINASYWRYRADTPYGNYENDQGTAAVGTLLDASPEYTLKGISATYDFDNVSVFYGYAKNDYLMPQSGTSGGAAIRADIGIGVETHELRFSSTAQKPWRWTAGLYRRSASRFDLLQVAAFGLDTRSGTDSSASSVFGEVTYTFPEFPLEATLGLRHFRDRLSAHDVDSGVAAPDINNRFSANNPRFSLAYRPNANQQIYTSASKGFRSGQTQVTGLDAIAARNGITLPSAIKPDSIWTYELGTKLSALERRLNMEFAVYHSDWKDFAVRLPLGTSGLNGLINSTGTRTNGIDASFAYAVTRSLTATLNAGYLDARYKDAVPGTGIHADSAVDDVPHANVSASGEYRFAGPAGWEGLARAGVQYVSSHPVSASSLQLAGDAVTAVDARLAFSKGNWTVALFGENLGNDRGATTYRLIEQLSATEQDITASRLRPRTIGLELRYAMGK